MQHWIKKIMRVKSLQSIMLEAEGNVTGQLSRSLGLKDLIALGIGAVVGSGIFVTVGIAAAGSQGYEAAGPAVIYSFLLVSIACLFCALCYAEFASMIPIAGSAYTYSYATLGELIAWIIGWDLILEYAVGNVATAISWGSYFGSLLKGMGVPLPEWMLNATMTASPEVIAQAPHFFGIPFVCNLPAVLIMLFLGAILVYGIRESASINDCLVFVKILVILFVIGAASSYVNPENWTPFMPNGWAGVQAGAAVVFFAYIGFDAISCAAEETKDPGRTIPLGMIWTLVISTILYVVVALVLTGVVNYDQLGCADPMAMVFDYLHMPWAMVIVSLGALVAMTSVLLVFQIGMPRILFSMARDGLLPNSFMKVHPKYKTPYITTIGSSLAVAFCAGFMDLSVVIELCNIGTLFAFVLVCIGILVLRHTNPEARRPFRTPLVPLIPILGIISCLVMIAAMPPVTWIRFIIWLGIGIVIYFCYGIKHSRLNSNSPATEPQDLAPTEQV